MGVPRFKGPAEIIQPCMRPPKFKPCGLSGRFGMPRHSVLWGSVARDGVGWLGVL